MMFYAKPCASDAQHHRPLCLPPYSREWLTFFRSCTSLQQDVQHGAVCVTSQTCSEERMQRAVKEYCFYFTCKIECMGLTYEKSVLLMKMNTAICHLPIGHCSQTAAKYDTHITGTAAK